MVDRKCGPPFCVITLSTSTFLKSRNSELNFLLYMCVYIYMCIYTGRERERERKRERERERERVDCNSVVFYNTKQPQQKHERTMNIVL